MELRFTRRASGVRNTNNVVSIADETGRWGCVSGEQSAGGHTVEANRLRVRGAFVRSAAGGKKTTETWRTPDTTSAPPTETVRHPR